MFANPRLSASSDRDLDLLSQFMCEEKNIVARPNLLPAGYTYLAQFIDHDIALDSDRDSFPGGTIDPSTISNLRSPFFDLETIYGIDKPPQPGEVVRKDLLKTPSLLKRDDTRIDTITDRFPNDLPRYPNSPVAAIVDNRNDAILPVAQTQVAFIKFHNAIAASLGGDDNTARFDKAREIAIRTING
ncbi:MAG TPA: hypothetical protein VGO50_02450 [Pyrinomonadaceae bacterium]|jgi:hypothetical protein|nr:hypothetical protein [Pyrinomonadaceae bacterium]